MTNTVTIEEVQSRLPELMARDAAGPGEAGGGEALGVGGEHWGKLDRWDFHVCRDVHVLQRS